MLLSKGANAALENYSGLTPLEVGCREPEVLNVTRSPRGGRDETGQLPRRLTAAVRFPTRAVLNSCDSVPFTAQKGSDFLLIMACAMWVSRRSYRRRLWPVQESASGRLSSHEHIQNLGPKARRLSIMCRSPKPLKGACLPELLLLGSYVQCKGSRRQCRRSCLKGSSLATSAD